MTHLSTLLNIYGTNDITPVLDNMKQSFLNIVKNTQPNTALETTSIIASIVTISGILLLYPLYLELKKDKINDKTYLAILDDLIRHFYRNKVIIISMKIKYILENKTNTGNIIHPSEEHFLKLSSLEDDLHLEKYNRQPHIFKPLHELHLLLRNFNIETQVALKHILDASTPTEAIERDFDCLNYKCGVITKAIFSIRNKIKKTKQTPLEIILSESLHDAACSNNEVFKAPETINNLIYNELSNEKTYIELLNNNQDSKTFIQHLTCDILKECSEINTSPSKVYIIKRKSN